MDEAAAQAAAATSGDQDGAYVEGFFRDHAVAAIANHDASAGGSAPLFLSYAAHLVHTPLQVPGRYVHEVDRRVAAAGGAPLDAQGRRLYGAMTVYLDDVVGNLVDAVKGNGIQPPISPSRCSLLASLTSFALELKRCAAYFVTLHAVLPSRAGGGCGPPPRARGYVGLDTGDLSVGQRRSDLRARVRQQLSPPGREVQRL